MSETYFDGIDVLKGFLILFIILGHIIERTPNMSSNLHVVYIIIYSFTMPVFIGISGFLLNKKFLIHSDSTTLFSKYFHRLIIPFLIILLFYSVIYHFGDLNLLNWLDYLFFPQVWLWYIPFICLAIVLTTIFLKLNVSDKSIVIFTFLISLSWILVYYYILSPSDSGTILDQINYSYRPEYLCFFALGFYMRNNEIKDSLVTLSGYALIVFFLYRVYYSSIPQENGFLSIHFFTVDFYLLNISLLIFSLKRISVMEFPSLSRIKWIGKNSLPIYLWHIPVLAIGIILYNKHILNGTGWCLFNLCGILLLFVAIYFLSKFRFFDEYFFGNVPKKAV
jgi:acyltransferase